MLQVVLGRRVPDKPAGEVYLGAVLNAIEEPDAPADGEGNTASKVVMHFFDVCSRSPSSGEQSMIDDRIVSKGDGRQGIAEREVREHRAQERRAEKQRLRSRIEEIERFSLELEDRDAGAAIWPDIIYLV